VKISLDGLSFLAAQEGCVLHVYRDQVGVLTIGVGHALRPGESYPDGISHDEAMALLTQDVASAEAAVNSDVCVPMSQNQFDVLVDFVFNCGRGALEHSSVLACLNAGDYMRAADALLLWDKGRVDGQLVELPVLRARRAAERELFLKPDE
jgi:lysozyme